MNELGAFIGDMFKNFPKFTILAIFIIVYALWRSTGGVERGESRRAAGEDGLFVEVTGVPEQYGENEVFGSIPEEEIEGDSESGSE